MQRSAWSKDSADDPNATVAISRCVRDPDSAVLAPVWRTAAESKPQSLPDLLAAAGARRA